MATANEVEKLALDLAEKERAILAAHLLKSLPAVLDDADEGMAEALQRDKEILCRIAAAHARGSEET